MSLGYSRYRPVPRYRVYRTINDGHLLGPAAVIECLDDAEAIGKAAPAANRKAAELWKVFASS